PGEGKAGLRVKGQYSRGGLSRQVQKGADIVLESAAGRAKVLREAEQPVGRGTQFLEKRLEKRADKWVKRAGRVEEAKLRAKGTKVAQIARRYDITDPEMRALRIVGEGVPYERVLAAQAQRVRDAERAYSEAADALYNQQLSGRATRRAQKALKYA